MQVGLQWIDKKAHELIALAQTIWEYAEVGLNEERSATAQAAVLKQEGFDVRMGAAGMPSALVASFGEGKPIIGFLGEYDALPGLSQKVSPYRDPVRPDGPGHGCGHNLLGVASLAAAMALKQEIESGAAKGTVRYYGCPAEELLVGKVFMARHGLFDDLDAAITWHPGSLNTAWYGSCLAMNSARFKFYGRTAHAAGAPHMGISALDGVELMNIGANYLREHVIQEARIHYVITRGGSEPNVVPPYAEVWYYVRAPRRADVEEIYARVLKIAEGATLMTNTRMEVEFLTGVYEVLPNLVVTELLHESLRKVGPPSFTEEEKAFARELERSFDPGQKASVTRSHNYPPEFAQLTLHEEVGPALDRGRVMAGSTDVGDVSWIVPTGQLTTACEVFGSAGHSWQIAATSGMSIGHKGMLAAAKAMALAGYELTTQPELLQKAKQAFQQDTAGQPYVCPLPEDLMEPAPQLVGD